jgi:hypothetical protein
MDNFYKFNFGIENIKNIPNYSIPKDKDEHISFKIDNVYHYLDESLFSFFEKNKLLPLYGYFFCTAPNAKSSIHIDGYPNNSRAFAFNIAWGSSNSKMCWFRTKENTIHNVNQKFTQVQSPYVAFTPEETVLVDEVIIDKLTLVRTNVPHQVINLDQDNWRYCLSIRTSNINNWEQIKSSVSNYFCDV